MDIGLITQFNHINYGNRLQNFATQEILKKLGFNVTSLVFSPSRFMIGFYPFLKAFGWFPLFQPINKRVKTFKAFTKKYLPNTRVIDSVSLKELTSTYSSAGTNPLDFVLIGSDQVWNPSYIVNYGKVFASFVEKEKRRSFATSFGVSKIPKNKISKFLHIIFVFLNSNISEVHSAIDLIHFFQSFYFSSSYTSCKSLIS